MSVIKLSYKKKTVVDFFSGAATLKFTNITQRVLFLGPRPASHRLQYGTASHGNLGWA